MADGQHIGCFLHLGRNLFGRCFSGTKAERNVVKHRHIRVERIVLKHHGDVSVFGRHIVHSLSRYRNTSSVCVFQSSNGSEQGAFAATGLTHQHGELSRRNRQIYAFDHMVVTVVLVKRLNL